MFVTKSTLQKSEAAYEARLGELRSSYEARISELLARVEDLRSLVFAPKSAAAPTPEFREADAILSASEKPILDIPEEEEELLREQNRIFSGEYEDGI